MVRMIVSHLWFWILSSCLVLIDLIVIKLNSYLFNLSLFLSSCCFSSATASFTFLASLFFCSFIRRSIWSFIEHTIYQNHVRTWSLPNFERLVKHIPHNSFHSHLWVFGFLQSKPLSDLHEIPVRAKISISCISQKLPFALISSTVLDIALFL